MTSGLIVKKTARNVATNYKVRATSVDNTNFYDEVNFTVVKVDIAQSNVYMGAGSSNNASFYLSADSSTNVTWTISPDVGTNGARFAGGQTGAGTASTWVGTNIWFSPGNVGTSYTIRAYATDFTNCCDTATGVVVKIEVNNIKFNWDTGLSSSDAINIRQDYNTNYDISNGEWVKDITNIPVCYTINKSVTIKARFTVQPSNITGADIWAVAMDTEGSLGDVLKTGVTFSGGVSSPEYVTLEIFDTMPSCIQKTACDVWQWKMENANGSGSAACNMNTSGVHTVYTILNEPVSPWVNTADNKTNAWITALDFVIDGASCNGDSSASAALIHIVQYLHGNAFGMSYDTSLGQSHYGMNLGTNGNFEFSSYINGGGIVNCYDQAAGVTVCSRLLGENCSYLYMNPFGYIFATDLVGIGQCNNPFYPSRSAPYNVPLLGTNGITDLIFTNRVGFGNHAFVRDSANIYDATCGPHFGNETLTQYATNAIDITSSAERTCPYFPSPDAYGNGDGIISTSEADSATVFGDVTKIH